MIFDRDPDLVLKTHDAPTANGREPLHGEEEWTLAFTLEDKRILHVVVGDDSRRGFAGCVLAELSEDARDDAIGRARQMIGRAQERKERS